MSVQIEGFEDLADELERESELIDEGQSVSIDELFTDGFMTTNTEFDSISRFFGESPWTIESETDFENIDKDQFDRYVDKHTGFNSWETMLSTAAREWLTRQMPI